MAFKATVVDSVVDSENLSYLLGGTASVTTAVVGGVTYVIAASPTESGVTVFSLDPSGQLTFVNSLADGNGPPLSGASALTSVTHGGRTYVFAGAPGDDTVTIMELGGDGSLTFVSEPALGQFYLDDVRALVTYETNGVLHLSTASASNSAIETFELDNGVPSWPMAASVDDDDKNIGGVRALEIVTVQGQRFLLAGGTENGFSILTLGGGVITGGKIDDDANLRLAGLTGFTSATINNATYIYATSATDTGVSVIQLAANGSTYNVQNYNFGVAVGPPKAFEVAGVQYVAFPLASGVLSFHRVEDDGRLTYVSQVQAAPSGSYPSAVSMTSVGGVVYAVVPSATGSGLSVIRLDDVAAVDGSAGGDVLPGTTGDDVINGNGGDDLVKGGDGLDTLSGGDDSDDLRGEDGDDTLNGDAGDDQLVGGAGSDTLNGGTGNDDLRGGAGDDVMSGGAGNDVYYVTEAGDQVVESANEGFDTVHWFVAADYVIPANVEVVRVQTDGAVDVLGNDLDNTIYGRAGANELDGGLGDDTIFGGAGNDVLWGRDGADVLSGDTGNDILYGGDGFDQLNGGAGNDLLDGGDGGDILQGGAGNDIYYVTAGDVVFENAGAGTDSIVAEMSWTLDANFENLTLLGTGDFNGTGNAVANVLEGNDGDNVLNGLDGADFLLGGGGDDVLIGGAGADKLTGGMGADRFVLTIDGVGASGLGVPAPRDTITDFSLSDGDKIDLSGIDAVNGGADDAFTFVTRFTGQAGQATLMDVAGGHTLLRIDLDGDGKADAEIMIQNVSLTASDDAWIL